MGQRKRPLMGLLLTMLLALVIAEKDQELEAMVQKARRRREDIRTYFLKIYEGSPELCAPVPEPSPSDKVSEDCLKGYSTG